jgi:hypothetical protein
MPLLHSTSGFSLLRHPPPAGSVGVLAGGAAPPAALARAPFAAAGLPRLLGRAAAAAACSLSELSSLDGPAPPLPRPAASSAAATASARSLRLACDTIAAATWREAARARFLGGFGTVGGAHLPRPDLCHASHTQLR